MSKTQEYRLDPPYDHIVISDLEKTSDSGESGILFTNERTGEVEEWTGPYAQALRKTLNEIQKPSV